MPKASKPVKVKRASGRPVGAKQKRDIATLDAMPDETANATDIPGLPPEAWKDAVRGRFYRPIKQAVSSGWTQM